MRFEDILKLNLIFLAIFGFTLASIPTLPKQSWEIQLLGATLFSAASAIYFQRSPAYAIFEDHLGLDEEVDVWAANVPMTLSHFGYGPVSMSEFLQSLPGYEPQRKKPDIIEYGQYQDLG